MSYQTRGTTTTKTTTYSPTPPTPPPAAAAPVTLKINKKSQCHLKLCYIQENPHSLQIKQVESHFACL